jgi:hypothetical protein
MATRVSIDVDLTLISESGELFPGAVEGLKALKAKDYLLTLWSYGGEDYARSIARKHNLDCFFEGYATKPDLVIDDEPEALSRLPTVDTRPQNGRVKHWSEIARHTVQLAEGIDNRSRDQDVPQWICMMKEDKYNVGVQCAVAIWNQRETYIRWPSFSRLLWPGLTRHKDGKSKTCYKYPQHLKQEIECAGYNVDSRNNGPAIHAFQLSGGDRSLRPYPENWGWTIHHIYDKTHQAPRMVSARKVPHAISDGSLFTHSAGLVALHPLADYIAMREPLLAWLLRWEAYRRFEGFDPMNIFSKRK